ncbi:MAG: DUF1294 domain-containing protein [Bacteroidota bacterium]|nr:DUF1294 domain-containing protein [Bacteroidota bacterium]
MPKLLLYYLLAINVIMLVVYIADKIKAKRHMWRIPESTLLSLAIVGGTVGALVGIFVIRHKSQHLKFRIGAPVIFVLQLAIAYWILWGM